MLLLFFRSTMAARYVGSAMATMLGRKRLALGMSMRSASFERFTHKLAGDGLAMADGTLRFGCGYNSAKTLVEEIFKSSPH